MKFCKRYEEYMMKRRTEKEELPRVGLKKLKKILRRCRSTDSQHLPIYRRDDGGEQPDGQVLLHNEAMDGGCGATATRSNCPDHCAVCDGTFFPPLLVEMAAIVGCFNERAQKLLELHLTSGFRKYFLWIKNKQQKDHGVLVQEGKDLITYAIINSIATRKILKKYDKIHYSNQGQAFRSRAQKMHIEILQSPWLCQLMALYINIRESTVKNKPIPGLFLDCSLIITDDRPMLSCGLFDSVKVDIDLTCSICLDTVFDPISLKCGHIFCYMCCCSAASVSIVDGLKAVNRKEKCPLCRQEGVYKGALHLDELNILLNRSCPDYWNKRLQTERVERLRQVKEHWESQCRSFMDRASDFGNDCGSSGSTGSGSGSDWDCASGSGNDCGSSGSGNDCGSTGSGSGSDWDRASGSGSDCGSSGSGSDCGSSGSGYGSDWVCCCDAASGSDCGSYACYCAAYGDNYGAFGYNMNNAPRSAYERAYYGSSEPPAAFGPGHASKTEM